MTAAAPHMFHGWTHNVGQMIAGNARVRGQCSKCPDAIPVDLEKVLAKHGPFYSLWNRHPRCPRRCGGFLTYNAQVRDSGMWPVLLRSDDRTATDRFHQVWKAERDAARAEELELGAMRKLRTRRSAVRAQARQLVDRWGLAAITQAEGDLYMPGLSDDYLRQRAEVYHEVVRRLRSPTPTDLDEAVG